MVSALAPRPRRRLRLRPCLAAIATALLLGLAPPAAAQVPVSAVVLDEQRLLTGSLYGRRVLGGYETERAALIAEGQALADDLAAEERALIDRRRALPPDEFRTLADAFDARVDEVRARQIGRERALLQSLDEAQRAFFVAAAPVLAELARELGASVILSPQAVLLSVAPEGGEGAAIRAADITEAAIARLDAVLGDGSGG